MARDGARSTVSVTWDEYTRCNDFPFLAAALRLFAVLVFIAMLRLINVKTPKKNSQTRIIGLSHGKVKYAHDAMTPTFADSSCSYSTQPATRWSEKGGAPSDNPIFPILVSSKYEKPAAATRKRKAPYVCPVRAGEKSSLPGHSLHEHMRKNPRTQQVLPAVRDDQRASDIRCQGRRQKNGQLPDVVDCAKAF